MFLKYIYFCLYINLKYLAIHDHTDLTRHFDAFHACCSDDLSIKCLYVDHKIYILLADNAFSSIFRRFFIFFENLNFWTFDFIAAFSSISFEFLAFDADLSFWTSVISNASSNIFKEFCMVFDNVNLLCNDDKSLMFNVDASS